MKISIITVCYNSAETISDCIQSILSQSYKNIEYIVVDGASKDNTMEVVKSFEGKFEGRMRYLSEKDTGIYDAMNKGLKMATGDVLGILNSDDLLADDFVIENYVEAFAKENVDALMSKVAIVDYKDTSNILRVTNNGSYKKGAFFRGWHPSHQAFYAKRELYEKYGYFNEDYKIAADYDLMFRFIEKHKISTKFIDILFARQREGGVSTTYRGYIKSNMEVMRILRGGGSKFPFIGVSMKTLPKLAEKTKLKIKKIFSR